MAAHGARSAARGAGRLGTLVLSFAAGVAGGVVALACFPAVAGTGRPAAKRAVKAALGAWERGREAAAELGEVAGDIVAEAKAEFEEERQTPPTDAPSRIVELHTAGQAQNG